MTPLTRGRSPRGLAASAMVLVYVLSILLPVGLIIVNSFRHNVDIFGSSGLTSFSPTLDNYTSSLFRLAFGQYLTNSVIVALASTLLSMALGTPFAYVLARLPVRGRPLWSGIVLFARMVPSIVLIVPLFVLFTSLQVVGTYAALIAAHTTFNLPLVIWMMRSFFGDIPTDLEEAARVDGASRLVALVRIVLPLAAPGLTATAVLSLLFSWNEFVFALVLSNGATRTMPVGIGSFVGTVSIDWGGSSAAAVLGMVPIFVIGLFAQRYLVRGLTMGAVKG